MKLISNQSSRRLGLLFYAPERIGIFLSIEDGLGACQIIANLKYFMNSISCILREYSACALLLDPSSSLIHEVARLLKIHSQDLPQSLLHRLQ